MFIKTEEKKWHPPPKGQLCERTCVPLISMFKQSGIAFTYIEVAEILTFWASDCCGAVLCIAGRLTASCTHQMPEALPSQDN